METQSLLQLANDLAILPDSQRKQANALLKRLSEQVNRAKQKGMLTFPRDHPLGGASISIPSDITLNITAVESNWESKVPAAAKELGLGVTDPKMLNFIRQIQNKFLEWLKSREQNAGILVADPALALRIFSKESGIQVPDDYLKKLSSVTHQANQLAGSGVRLQRIKITARL